MKQTLLLLTFLATSTSSLASVDASPLMTEGIVNAPVGKIWQAFTTSEGLSLWMAPVGKVDFRVGGKYRSSYKKDTDLTGPDVIENTILAFDPMRMITIRNTKAPKGFPFRKAMDNVWTVIYFTKLDDTHTKVEVRMVGFDETSDSQGLRKMFDQDNQIVMDAIKKNLSNR